MYRYVPNTLASKAAVADYEENDTSEAETEEQDLSGLDKMVVTAVSTHLMSIITTKVNQDEGDERPQWKQSVMDHFNDAWDELDPAEIWQRLNFLIALFAKETISWDSAHAFLQQDILDVARNLKENVIDTVMDGDYT
jgi:hypothetical protein